MSDNAGDLPQPAGAASPQDATAPLWAVIYRVLLRRGVVIDQDTAQAAADALLLLFQASQPAHASHPPAGPRSRPGRRRPPPENECEPLF
jgi:hypothetical protein